VAGTILNLIAKSLGETTDEVAQRVLADCRARAADPTDETDAVADAIADDMPEE
jgi:hypothetical protein